MHMLDKPERKEKEKKKWRATGAGRADASDRIVLLLLVVFFFSYIRINLVWKQQHKNNIRMCVRVSMRNRPPADPAVVSLLLKENADVTLFSCCKSIAEIIDFYGKSN